MARILGGVLVVLMTVGVAVAGIPDPDLSSIVCDNGGEGLVTCPAGDAAEFRYVTVTAKESGGTAIEGIPASSFFFDVTGGDVSFSAARVAGTPAHGDSTNANGEIKFSVVGDESIAYPTQLDIGVQIYTVVVTGTDTLWCNSFDYEPDGDVDPTDFTAFAGDYGKTESKGHSTWDGARSDFDWDGDVDPTDFTAFAGHYGH